MIGNLLQRLGSYVSFHFRTEEALMTGLPQAEKHASEHLHQHRLFVEQLAVMRARAEHESDGATSQLVDFLNGWLYDHILKTDRQDLTDEEVWRLYMLLTRVEAAFRAMKSPLMERPIFHHLEHRVQTHIFLCVLAYHLLVAIEKRFLDQGVHTSWATLREQLSTHQVVTVVLPATNGQTLRLRKGSTPDAVHREIYRTLKIPQEVMKPVRTWAPTPPP